MSTSQWKGCQSQSSFTINSKRVFSKMLAWMVINSCWSPSTCWQIHLIFPGGGCLVKCNCWRVTKLHPGSRGQGFHDRLVLFVLGIGKRSVSVSVCGVTDYLQTEWLESTNNYELIQFLWIRNMKVVWLGVGGSKSQTKLQWRCQLGL